MNRISSNSYLPTTGKPKDLNAFWDWFSQNEIIYFDIEQDMEQLIPQILDRLLEIHPMLSFEFSPVRENGKRNLYVSANGLKSLFPLVIEMVDCAPKLNYFEVHAFRQAKLEIDRLNWPNIHLEFNKQQFKVMETNNRLSLLLCIEEYQETDDWIMAVTLMLDCLIGEYDMEMLFESISVECNKDKISNSWQSLDQLPACINQHKQKFMH